MFKFTALFCALFYLASAEPPVQGIRPSNVLGGPEQHASFSFIRPGLTQTSYAFGGPSSHQSFSSSIGNPHLAQRVLPNIAQALAYRNPGLGYFSVGPISNGYAAAPVAPAFTPSAPVPLPYQPAIDPAVLAYYQQLHQAQQQQLHSYPATNYQTQLAQLLALRQAQLQAQAQQVQAAQPQHVPEQSQLQQEEEESEERPRQSQNLLGVAYSSAPSVAHVKVTGNGYKFDF
ncbi:hypothetical protein KM043_006393 [Ampulex compressa]|nr:hypothetical protein KM043_006393 [Ampulex compressa]